MHSRRRLLIALAFLALAAAGGTAAYGLSSEEFSPGMVAGILAELTREHPKKRFTIGIDDDVAGTSLAYDATLDIEPPETVRNWIAPATPSADAESRMKFTATANPRAPASRAVAAPMPRPAPVMMMVPCGIWRCLI